MSAATTTDQVAPSVPESQSDPFAALVADAYHDASLRGADMLRTVEALEAARRTASDDYETTWDALDAAIGSADDSTLQSVLGELRERFVDAAIHKELTSVSRAFEADPESGWHEWLLRYATALNRWRWPLVQALIDAQFAFPAESLPQVERIRPWTKLAAHDRWPEATGLLDYLGSCERLSAEVRAAMHVYSAQIQLYHLFLPEEAPPLLKAATELAPDLPVVLAGWAEYDLQRADHDGVRRRCNELRERHPNAVEGFNLAGIADERDNQVEAAERWYFDAQRVQSDDTSGYISLLRLYGRPEYFATHEARRRNLVDRIIAIDPVGEYNAWIELGLIYQQNERHDDAQAAFDRSVELDRTRMGAYTYKGYAASDAGDPAAAEAAFRKAIHVADEAFDGHWGLASVFEAQARWSEALDEFRASLVRRPEWESSIRGRIGAALIKLERYGEAEDELFAALRTEPTNDAVTSSLETLVATCYGDEPRVEDSIRILDTMREIKGASYDAPAANWLGNVRYYYERFDEAITAYAQAATLVPEEPVYHSNLAGAWERRNEPGARRHELAEAARALRRAHELAPDDQEFRTHLAAVEEEEKVVRVVGENPILDSAQRISVAVSRALLPAILDAEGDLSDELLEGIEAMRQRIRTSTGVVIPGVNFRELDEVGALYTISIRGTQVVQERLEPDKLFYADVDGLVSAGITGELMRQSLVGAWVDEPHRQQAEDAGLHPLAPMEYLLRHLEVVLRAELEQLVDHLEASTLLAEAEIETDKLTELVPILRALTRDHVPIVALAEICAALTGEDDLERVRMIPALREALPGNDSRTTLRRIDTAVEQQLMRGLERSGTAGVLELPRQERRPDVLRGAKPRRGEEIALVVADTRLRPLVAALAAGRQGVTVIAEAELLPERRELLDGARS